MKVPTMYAWLQAIGLLLAVTALFKRISSPPPGFKLSSKDSFLKSGPIESQAIRSTGVRLSKRPKGGGAPGLNVRVADNLSNTHLQR
jgi:hypothetical protein